MNAPKFSNLGPYEIGERNILGLPAHISMLPEWVSNGKREGSLFIVKFKDRIREVGPSFMFMEYKEDPAGDFRWVLSGNSPIKDRSDLFAEACRLIDEWYDAWDQRSTE